MALGCAGERAAGMPEELGLQQRFRDRRTIDPMHGPTERGDLSWTRRATRSLPEPLSP
ncbi:MAG TPA: hypothetical protein VEQ59_24515 [Polyangiaceae bacterium]|nr:hypothetical protein [Polyangiaceae bacterium]